MEDELIKVASATLKKAALNEAAKDFVLSNEKLYRILKKAANRYIAGETLEQAIPNIQKLVASGFAVTTDFMGESIRTETIAAEATAEFVQFAKAIKQNNIHSSISLDLSHIGLLISKDLAKENLRLICEEAAKTNQEVIISMEGADRIDAILDIYKETFKTNPNVAITMQAYLYRSKDDFKDLMSLPGSIRLIKGAYHNPKNVSMERGPALDEVYLDYVQQLFTNNHHCAIASHHNKIHDETIKLIDKYQPANYVLERCLGIGNEELELYKNNGYKSRIYVVYGTEWYLYLCNRWAEYPLHLFRGLADITG